MESCSNIHCEVSIIGASDDPVDLASIRTNETVHDGNPNRLR